MGMFRTWPSIQSLMEEISRMTLLFSSPTENLFLTSILTRPVFLPLTRFLITTCFATGWGKDQFGAAGQYQVVLKEIDLPVVNHGVCQDKLRTTRLGQKYKLHDSFLCAGGIPGKDTCKGDGGSPLVCPSKYDPNTYVQAGIVAWGIGCGEQGTPGVYADVSKATCWIDQAITCHYSASTGNYNSFMGYTSMCVRLGIRTRLRHSSRRPTLLASLARSSTTSSTSTVNAVFNGNRVLLLL